jgi:hypothetical protein
LGTLQISQTSDVGSKVSAGKDLTITAGQNVIAKAADLKAQGGVDIAAQGTVLLNAGQTRSSYDAVLTKSSSDLISTTTTQTQTQASAAMAQLSSVQGQNVNIVAGQHLISVGTQFKGIDSLRVEGQDTSTFYAATDVHQISTTTHTKTDLGAAFSAMLDPLGFGTPIEEKTVTDARASSTSIGTSLLSDKKIEIGVGNKTELQGTKVEAQQIAFNLTDPNKAGVLILGGSTDTTQTSHTEKSETLGLYQEMKGNGSTTETLNQTQLQGNVSFDNALKITVQIPDTKGGQELKSQINALVEQSGGTGLEYLNQLAANPNIKWDQIALANEKWSYDQAGLTPAGAALVSIAMAVVTGPGAASFASGLTTSGAMSAAMAAGMTSLASQAAVALINNQGDIGKTLEQLGSEESIKGLLTTMVTAGALDKLGNSTFFNGQGGTAAAGSNGISTAQTAATFGDKLLKNITNNIAGSAIDAAINGKPFDEKTLTNALASALVTTGMAQGAKAIGDAKYDGDINGFTQKVAHAVLGCAGGAATAGNMSGCGAGAVGAVVGEMAAEYYMDSNKDNGKTFAENKANALAFAKVMSATAGVIAGGGGDNAAAVNIANTTGTNAAENNYLNHVAPNKARMSEADQYAAAAAACTTLGSDACNLRDALAAKSRERDADLAKACSGATPDSCNLKKAEAIAMGNKVYTTEGGFVYANSPDKGAIQKLNIATIGGISRPQNFNDQLSQSTADALIQGTGTVALGGGVVRSAVVAFGIGAGFDAAGQYVQSGTIRPEQSVVAGTTAAVFAPLAARGNLWLPIAGASTAGLNTTFNNYFYDENTNAFVATGLGAAFGTVGPILGKTTQKWASPYITSTPYIPTSGSAYIPIAQPRWLTVPGYVGSTINNTVSNVPSFIPLDNGKPVQGSQP